jgi:hypothetical protein
VTDITTTGGTTRKVAQASRITTVEMGSIVDGPTVTERQTHRLMMLLIQAD